MSDLLEIKSANSKPTGLCDPHSGRLLSLPPASAAQVFIDFDGTLTQTDVIDQLIFRFAINNQWKELERLWALREIGSAQCLREELALVRITDRELQEFLESIRLDPGVEKLLEVICTGKVPLTILSDGLDYFIHVILARHRISGLDIRCNRMVRSGTSIGLEFPHQQANCQVAAGHCKCASARTTAMPGRTSIYIGDGLSDWCAARTASVVFAKGALAQLMKDHGQAFYPFDILRDVAEVLSEAWLGSEH